MPADDKLVFAKLNDKNYATWAGNFCAMARKKKFYKIMVGKEVKPVELGDKREDWEDRASEGAGTLYLAVEDDQKVNLKGLEDDVKLMWDKLEGLHIQKRPATRFNAYSALFNIRKESENSLPSLITKVDSAMQDIKSLASPDLSIDSLYQDLASMALIRSLPADYSSFVSTVVLMPDFSYDRVKEAFRLEEHNRQARLNDTQSVSTIANAAFQRSSAPAPSTTPKSSLSCSFCEGTGHNLEMCFAFRDFKARAIDNRRNKQQAGGRPKRVGGSVKAAQSASESAKESAEVTEFAGTASLSITDALAPCSDDTWTADTGATSHMSPHRHWFAKYEPLSIPIRLADGNIVYSAGVGSVRFQPVYKSHKKRLLEFQRVLHVPKLSSNLLSVLYLSKSKGYRVIAQHDFMKFYHSGKLLFSASVDDHRIAKLDGYTLCTSPESSNIASTVPLDLQLWHRRFSHLNYSDVKRLVSGNLVTGLSIKSNTVPDPICEPCTAGKQHRTVIKESDSRYELLGLIHSDLHGPLPTATPEGYKYWITFIDHHSRFAAVQLLRNKSDAFAAFKVYKSWLETQTGRKIKILRDDKGGEYMSNAFDAFCAEHGIARQHTVRNEPHQNGVAERFNRTIEEGATSMLSESGLPPSFLSAGKAQQRCWSPHKSAKVNKCVRIY
jgi:gag-polypeptide of LTR copia-type/GAG-pre-integrase domain/Integrase core domain